jgi:hypothetical protein
MALTLSTTGITNSETIQAGHVSQSIDALKGTYAYNLTPSGSFTFTGTTVFAGNVQGAISNIVSQTVGDADTVTVNVNDGSTSVYVLSVDSDGNQGSNPISYQLPRPSGITPGTTYRIIIGQIGSSSTSPDALSRPFSIIIAASNQALLGSIVGTSSTAQTVLQRSNGPFVSLAIAAGRLNTGDSFDLFCDGTYWYVTGFINSPSVSYTN